MTRRSRRLAIALLLLPAVGFVALFLSAVLVMTVMQSVGFFSFASTEEFGFEGWQAALSDETTWDAFFYSARIALMGAFGSLLLAYPAALYLRRPFAGNATLTAIIRTPLFVPGLVAAFLILNIISYHGIVNEALVRIGLLSEPLRMTHDDLGLGVVAIEVWLNVPFLALILSAVIANIPGDLEAAAQNLGAGPWQTFFRVVLPLSVPGVLTGLTLVFIAVFGDFAINSVAGPLYPPTLSIRMYTVGQSFGEWSQAAVLGILIMVGLIIAAWFFTLLAKLTVRIAR